MACPEPCKVRDERLRRLHKLAEDPAADIQEMLGYADISTTMGHTDVTIRQFREVYARTHSA